MPDDDGCSEGGEAGAGSTECPHQSAKACEALAPTSPPLSSGFLFFKLLLVNLSKKMEYGRPAHAPPAALSFHPVPQTRTPFPRHIPCFTPTNAVPLQSPQHALFVPSTYLLDSLYLTLMRLHTAHLAPTSTSHPSHTPPQIPPPYSGSGRRHDGRRLEPPHLPPRRRRHHHCRRRLRRGGGGLQ